MKDPKDSSDADESSEIEKAIHQKQIEMQFQQQQQQLEMNIDESSHFPLGDHTEPAEAKTNSGVDFSKQRNLGSLFNFTKKLIQN